MDKKTENLTHTVILTEKKSTQQSNVLISTDNPSEINNSSTNQNQIAHIQNQDGASLQKKSSDYQNLQLSHQINQKATKVKTLASLVSIEDQYYPSISLEPSSGLSNIIQIQIMSYRTTTFMAMTTQIFKIKVLNKNKQEQYEIQRRFSEFADLYEQIFYNHPSYILHPFPDKTVQSFIKMKLDLIVESGQKNQLIQKRIKQLNQFVNWVASHKQICNSEEFINFIEKDQKKYQQVRNRLNKYVEEYKKLQYGSHLQGLIDAGKQILSNYLNINDQKNYGHRKESIQFQIVIEQKNKINKMISQVTLLLKAQKQFSQFQTINTDNDALLKICAKHASGVDYSYKFYLFLQTNTLLQLNSQKQKLEEAEKSLLHVFAIMENIEWAEKKSDFNKKGKLQRRLQRAQRNFKVDWEQFQKQFKKNILKIAQEFTKEWKNYKMQMKKIWRVK